MSKAAETLNVSSIVQPSYVQHCRNFLMSSIVETFLCLALQKHSSVWHRRNILCLALQKNSSVQHYRNLTLSGIVETFLCLALQKHSQVQRCGKILTSVNVETFLCLALKNLLRVALQKAPNVWFCRNFLYQPLQKPSCARSCEPGSQCHPNESIFGSRNLRGVGILE